MALLKYILKKMLMLLPVLVGISIIAFALGIMSPGDPVDQVLNPNGNEPTCRRSMMPWRQKWAWTSRR